MGRGIKEELKGTLRRAAEEFNRYHAPEVSAKIVRSDGNRVTVEFEGRSCRSCGGQDYLEDFGYEAGDLLGKRIDLVRFERRRDRGFIGVYQVGAGADGPSDQDA